MNQNVALFDDNVPLKDAIPPETLMVTPNILLVLSGALSNCAPVVVFCSALPYTLIPTGGCSDGFSICKISPLTVSTGPRNFTASISCSLAPTFSASAACPVWLRVSSTLIGISPGFTVPSSPTTRAFPAFSCPWFLSSLFLMSSVFFCICCIFVSSAISFNALSFALFTDCTASVFAVAILSFAPVSALDTAFTASVFAVPISVFAVSV